MQKELPKRKSIRLKNYDYSQAGAYFITICVKNGQEMLGRVVGRDDPGAPFVQLSEYGNIAKKYIESIEPHYSKEGVIVDKYVIMPNHVHLLIVVCCGAPRSSRPTNALLPNILAAFKKMTDREFGFTMWQNRYHDHVIRSESSYRRIWQYIDQNPSSWADDCYYIK